jgi:hypothetical protein
MVEIESQAFVRRRAARLPVEWPALWDVGIRTSWYQGIISDVSPFGAFVRFKDTPRLPNHGDPLTMLVEIAGEPFLVEGVVRWTPPGGAGIAFAPEYGVVGEALAWELAERGGRPLVAVG